MNIDEGLDWDSGSPNRTCMFSSGFHGERTSDNICMNSRLLYSTNQHKLNHSRKMEVPSTQTNTHHAISKLSHRVSNFEPFKVTNRFSSRSIDIKHYPEYTSFPFFVEEIDSYFKILYLKNGISKSINQTKVLKANRIQKTQRLKLMLPG